MRLYILLDQPYHWHMNITKTRQLSSFLLTPLSLGLPNKPRQYSTYVVITGGWLIFMEKLMAVIPERIQTWALKLTSCCANGKPKLPTTMSPNYVLKHTHILVHYQWNGNLLIYSFEMFRQNMYKKESKLFRPAIDVLIWI